MVMTARPQKPAPTTSAAGEALRLVRADPDGDDGAASDIDRFPEASERRLELRRSP